MLRGFLADGWLNSTMPCSRSPSSKERGGENMMGGKKKRAHPCVSTGKHC